MCARVRRPETGFDGSGACPDNYDALALPDFPCVAV